MVIYSISNLYYIMFQTSCVNLFGWNGYLNIPLYFSSTNYLSTVGAGTAGCVLANRLSEDPENKVLLLEAGGEEINVEGLNIPMSATEYQRSSLDWSYTTVPQQVACGSYERQVWKNKSTD